MANMREIRTRMKSIQDTMKITNAMYLISSSKMKKARRTLEATLPYFITLRKTIRNILVHSPDLTHVYFDRRASLAPENRKRGIILITADKGLAGAYNHNLIKLAELELKKAGHNVLFPIGLAGRQHFMQKQAALSPDFYYTNYQPSRYRARSIAEMVVEKFDKGELDEMLVIYTRMTTPMKAEPEVVQLLPLLQDEFVEMMKNEKYEDFNTYSPSPQAVMQHLVPNYIKGFLYGAMVEAYSAEQHARMTAMKSATDNAKDMLHDLSLLYNRARQAAITQEINEVVSGAAAEER